MNFSWKQELGPGQLSNPMLECQQVDIVALGDLIEFAEYNLPTIFEGLGNSLKTWGRDGIKAGCNAHWIVGLQRSVQAVA
jgi:hypothetical protein